MSLHTGTHVAADECARMCVHSWLHVSDEGMRVVGEGRQLRRDKSCKGKE